MHAHARHCSILSVEIELVVSRIDQILRSLFFFSVGTSFDVHLGVWAFQFLYKLQGATYMEDLETFMLLYIS